MEEGVLPGWRKKEFSSSWTKVVLLMSPEFVDCLAEWASFESYHAICLNCG
jgi:hypothetical protein